MVEAARGLIGACLVREANGVRRVGRIIEVEAYAGPEDRASHARFGLRSRAATMFGAPGRAYVYGVYGTVRCLNVVTGPEGQAAAVLLRAVEPLAGAEPMRAARIAHAVTARREDPVAAAARLERVPDARLAVGPGNLAAAFAVGLADDGADLLDPAGSLRLEPRPEDGPPLAIRATPRIGIAYAGPGWADRPWRFVAALAR